MVGESAAAESQQPLPKEDPSNPWPAPVTPLPSRAHARVDRDDRRDRDATRDATTSESERVREERARARGEERVRAQREASERRDASRSLALSERLLIRWLVKHLNGSGVETLVIRYGGRAVVNALHDGVVEYYVPFWGTDVGRKANGGWRAKPHWRNPMGMLVKLLRDRYS